MFQQLLSLFKWINLEKRPILICFFLIGLLTINAQSNAHKKEKFISNLMKKMTLDEKIGQLNLLTAGSGIPTGSVVSKDVEQKIIQGNVGALFGIHGPDKIRKAQDLAVKKSRLGIPLIFGSDVIHGYQTTFPIPLGIASCWDMKWIEKSARIAAQEASANGINWTFSPMVDICRDPRWGRIAEGAGEDAFYGSQVAKAMVKGYQGNDLAKNNTILSCVKHFALYGASEAGRDYNTTDMSKIRMYSDYLPPYKAAIDAGASSVMTSFNDVDGIPATGNKWLLTELLRNQWKFDGFVVSDYTALNEMSDHGLGDLKKVTEQAINAGLDMDMVGEGFLKHLKSLLHEKKISKQQIDLACKRILEAKYALGLFDDPFRYIDEHRAAMEIMTVENRKFARDLAARSCVLLKNLNHLLPLDKKDKIALIGPLADNKNNMLGTWAVSGDPQQSITVYEGMKQNTSSADNIVYAKGANISDDTILAKNVNVFGTRIDIDQKSSDQMIEEALKVAAFSEKIVAIIGEASEMSGESSSRTNLELPESQKKLIRALKKTGKPLILVLMSGRPLILNEEHDLADAIILSWHPGTEAGNAISDVLFGAYNPSGKLTVSFPRSVGQIPVYYNHKNTGRPATKIEFEKFRSHYLDASNFPLFPFGFGLSYTKFEYGELILNQKIMTKSNSLIVSCKITNSGDFDGEEIVQLYLRDLEASVTRPIKELKGFEKILLKKGESKEVSFTLTEQDLKFFNAKLEYVAEPGDFKVFIGTNSDLCREANFSFRND